MPALQPLYLIAALLGAPGHWAFQAPVRPDFPEVRGGSGARNAIDRFILARLEEKGLALSPEAGREAILRRVAFDLTGLPPGVQETAAFLSDGAPGAYERMVERFLASPRYGERWGRHWLDAAGYADSNGYFHADSDRPLAYRYRDYVIASFNGDKPFDRFIEEQIAGDELAGLQPDGDVTPEMTEALIATHFLRNAPDGTGESDGNPEEVRADRLRVLEGTVQIIGSAFLALTFQCARCHDHKFDPITQKEYYQMQAILYPAYIPDRWVKPADRAVSEGTRAEREEHRKLTAAAQEKIQASKKALADFIAPLRRKAIDQNLGNLDGELRARIGQALDVPEKKRSAEQKELIRKHAAMVEVGDEELAKRFPELPPFRAASERETARLEKEFPPPLPKISILTDVLADPPPHHVFIRGDYSSLGEEAGPGVPAFLCTPADPWPAPQQPPSTGKAGTGRRTALARWLASPGNPLVARVLMNRIWQHHFGKGLVSTSGNFGRTGSPPTHPELLDFLATELIRRGWSIKEMHRLILGSAAYRQSGAWREDASRADPENHLLWRFPLARLDAEALRDAILSAAGELDCRMAGPYTPTRYADDGRVVVDEGQPGARRRSVYLQQRRSQMLTLLDLFDSPKIVANCTRRDSSTMPLQSLALLNSEFVIEKARAFARRVQGECGAVEGARIDGAFALALGRQPDAEERSSAEAFLREQSARYADPAAGSGRALDDFCQMLFASNAFLYVD